MADIIMVRRGAGLVPAFHSDAEAISKIPVGVEVKAKITQARNIKMHRKVFALLNLGFQYFEPELRVTTIERNTVLKFGKFMVANGLPAETAKTLCVEFMNELNARREHVEVDRSFDAFRDYVTVEAGFFRAVQTPGGIRKEPMSISFASMDQNSFGQYYRAVFGVLWRLVLSKSFPSEQAAENAVDQLLSFD